MREEPREARVASRETIREEATRIFRAKGYRATSLEDVASAFGISRPALYYHYKSKREILYAIYQVVSDVLVTGAAEISARDLPAADKFRLLIRHHIETIVSNAARMAVYYDEETELGEQERVTVRATRRRYTQMLVDLYAKGIQEGEFADLPPRLAVYGIVGGVNWTYKWYDTKGSYSPSTVADSIERLLLDGYRAKKPGSEGAALAGGGTGTDTVE